MKKIFAFLLAIAFMFQMSWSMAAEYCQHEADTEQHNAHFGHHQHSCAKETNKHNHNAEENNSDGNMLLDHSDHVFHAESLASLPQLGIVLYTQLAQSPYPDWRDARYNNPYNNINKPPCRLIKTTGEVVTL